MNGWIYSAIIISILVGIFGLGVGAAVLGRIFRISYEPRPVLIWLLIAISIISGAHALEQWRVLMFRLSFDGYIDPNVFGTFYSQSWNVISSKLAASVALAAAAAVKLAVFYDKEHHKVIQWGINAAITVACAWFIVAIVLEFLEFFRVLM